MSEHECQNILNEINAFRYQLKDLEGKLDDLEKDIRREFSHNLEKVEWKVDTQHHDYDRRISMTEKVVFGAVSIILITVMGALLAKVII